MTSKDREPWSARRKLGALLRRWAAAQDADKAPDANQPRAPFGAGGRGQAVRRSFVCGRGRRPSAEGERDRGAATIFVLAIGLVLVAAGLAGAAVGAARVGRHQARVAADLGALAGAARAVEGEGAACARATRFVAANRGRVVACRLDGWEIVVRVDVEVTPLPGMTRHATEAARAGPVTIVTQPPGRTARVGWP